MIVQRFQRVTRALLVLAGAGLVSATSFANTQAEAEAQAARDFAAIKASEPLSTDQEVIDYVACVANAVVDALDPEVNIYNWEMAILETNQLNAFVMPGGKIVVFEGLLRAARDQHQLAAVMGHEIAHVTAGHTKRKLLQGKTGEIGIQVAAVLLGGGHYGATYTAQEMLNQGMVYMYYLPYKRSNETEADVVGLEFMAQAGFDPRAAVELWKNMEEESGGAAPAEFVSTHPAPENRIDSLVSQWIEVLPLYNQAHKEGRIPDCQLPSKLKEYYDQQERQPKE